MNINELLGISVAKEAYTEITTDISVGDSEYKYVRTTVLNIEKEFDKLKELINKHKDLSDIIFDLEATNRINRKMVSDLNIVYPDLLATNCRLEDFTVNETATGVEKVSGFLKCQLNFIYDDMYQLWYSNVYKALEEFVERVSDKRVIGEAINDLKKLDENIDGISGNNKLSVFADGVLYKMLTYGVTEVFINGLLKTPIKNVDTNSYVCLARDIKEHLSDSEHDGLLSQIVEASEIPDMDKEYSLAELHEKCSHYMTDVVESSYDKNLDLLNNMYSISKSMKGDTDVRNKIVDELMKTDVDELLSTWSWFYPVYYVFHLIYDLRKLTDFCKG